MYVSWLEIKWYLIKYKQIIFHIILILDIDVKPCICSRKTSIAQNLIGHRLISHYLLPFYGFLPIRHLVIRINIFLRYLDHLFLMIAYAVFMNTVSKRIPMIYSKWLTSFIFSNEKSLAVLVNILRPNAIFHTRCLVLVWTWQTILYVFMYSNMMSFPYSLAIG